MKLKFSKKYRWIGIGASISLTTLALSACAPILVSCNDDKKDNDDKVPGIDNGGHNDQEVTDDTTSLNVNETAIYNALNNMTSIDWDDNNKTRIEIQIKSSLTAALGNNSNKVTYCDNSVKIVKKPSTEKNEGEITFVVNIDSNNKLTFADNNGNVEFNQNTKTFTIKNLAFEKEPKPDTTFDNTEFFNKLNGQTVSSWKDETAATTLIKEALTDGNNSAQFVDGSITDFKAPKSEGQTDYSITFKATISTTIPPTSEGNVTFTKESDNTTYTITVSNIVVNADEFKSEFQVEIEKLFTFNNFLPSEATKTAMLDTNYWSVTNAEEDSTNSSIEIMDLYKQQMCTLLGLTNNDIVSTPLKDMFNYEFTIDLNDSICQTLYQKSFQSICNQIKNANGYNDLFHNAQVSSISGIKLIFIFNKYEEPLDFNLMGFTLTQKVSLSFGGNNQTIEKEILNNNNQINNKKMFFLVEFDSTKSELENGSSVPLNSINFTVEQIESLIKILQDNIKNWTKDDILYVNKSVDSLPDLNDPNINPKYLNLVDEVNNFFVDNGLDLSIMGMNIPNTSSDGSKVFFEDEKNHVIGISPILILDQYTYITFSNDKFSCQYNKYTNNWTLLVSENIPIYTAAKTETLKLSENSINEIKNIVEPFFAREKTKFTDDEFFDRDTGDWIVPQQINDLINKINKYLSQFDNGKYSVSPNMWGGRDYAYQLNEETGEWTVNFAIQFKLTNNSLSDNTFVRLDVPRLYSNPKSQVHSEIYDLNYFLTFNNIKSSVPAVLVVSEETGNQINSLLSQLAKSLTSQENALALLNKPQVAKINQLLNTTYGNPNLKVKEFNIWCGWGQQGTTSDGFKTLNLAMELNLTNAGFDASNIIVKSKTLVYDSYQGAQFLRPAEPYKTGIKA